jgi:hypothetical protein
LRKNFQGPKFEKSISETSSKCKHLSLVMGIPLFSSWCPISAPSLGKRIGAGKFLPVQEKTSSQARYSSPGWKRSLHIHFVLKIASVKRKIQA